MPIRPHDLTDLICGTLRLIEPTAERDSTHRIVWKTECQCGQIEYGSSVQLAKFAGHSECPGHPFKGKEKPIEGFQLHPDNKETPEHAVAVAAWESRRHPEQPKVESNVIPLTKASAVLESRLGLTNYCTETQVLTQPVEILGCTAEKVVFAKQIDGDDRVLLHIQLVSASGKRSIASSKKKIPEGEWLALTAQLSEMNITWREKEPKQRTAA